MKKLLIAVIACLALCVLGVQAQGPTGRAVTQITNATTGVTINTDTGVITTVSLTNAAAAVTTFTVTNSAVTAASTVVTTVQGYTGAYGTNGFPVAFVNAVGAGTFNISLANVGANALAGVVQIGFIVR
jgi:hypothetical protein